MIELETRLCACDCGGTFKVMPSSHHRFISQDHEEQASMVMSKQRARGLVSTKNRNYRPRAPQGFISAAVLAERLGIKRVTVYAWVKQGIIPAEGSGREKYFDYATVKAALKASGKEWGDV